MSGEVRIGVLGPLEVRAGPGHPVEVAGTRLRRLLLRLALDPGRVVTSARLVDAVWDERPPAGAANALQALVHRPGPRRQVHPAQGGGGAEALDQAVRLDGVVHGCSSGWLRLPGAAWTRALTGRSHRADTPRAQRRAEISAPRLVTVIGVGTRSAAAAASWGATNRAIR